METSATISVLARQVRLIRTSRGLTLAQLSKSSKISISALSKIENGNLSPTYEVIVKLARGLKTDISSLFAENLGNSVTGRRAISYGGSGTLHKTNNYTFTLLSSEVSQKKMIPAIVQVSTHDIEKFGPLSSHEGDDFVYVLKGTIVLHTEFYAPTLLSEGDCVYFDSRMRHGCISQGEEDATVLWVSSAPIFLDTES